jgi:hypothetical protein
MAESGAAGGPTLALELIECIHDVAQEMKSIGYLNGVRRAQSESISDAESTVTRDDLGAGMLAQPSRQGRRFIVGQHVNTGRFEVQREPNLQPIAGVTPLGSRYARERTRLRQQVR